MIEYVYRPSRRVRGKTVRARLYSGAYSLAKGEKPRRVALHTPDKRVAQKMLRDVIVEAQMRREGMVLPVEQVQAAKASLVDLAREYHADLRARTTAKNADESCARLEACIRGAGWSYLVDVTPASWVAFRAALTQSAKTRRDYQTSLMAFLNWLVRLDRLPRNPLAKVDRISIKGKQVRPVRSFTDEEICRLLAVATPARRLVYLFLLYTGLRKGTVKKLVVGDLHLEGDRPYVLAPASIMKGAAKLALPLRPDLVAEIRLQLPAGVSADRLLFHRTFPKRDTLHRDFERAGIQSEDGQGRVVHFHAFRKTFQTLGVRSGVNQRAAQALLAHTDPRLTANVYTDVAALELHSEVAKLPWFGGSATPDGVFNDVAGGAQNAQEWGFRDVLEELIRMAQLVVSASDNNLKAGAVAGNLHRHRLHRGAGAKLPVGVRPPNPDRAIAFERQTVIATRRHRRDVGQAAHRHRSVARSAIAKLPRAIVAESDHRAVVHQDQGVKPSGRHRLRSRRARQSNLLRPRLTRRQNATSQLRARIFAPRPDRAVRLERHHMVTARRDRPHRPHRHDAEGFRSG